MDLVQLTQITSQTEDTINFLRNRNLLKTTFQCCQNENCTEVKSRSTDGKEFRCRVCNKRYSIRTDSIFFQVHILLSIYCC